MSKYDTGDWANKYDTNVTARILAQTKAKEATLYAMKDAAWAAGLAARENDDFVAWMDKAMEARRIAHVIHRLHDRKMRCYRKM